MLTLDAVATSVSSLISVVVTFNNVVVVVGGVVKTPGVVALKPFVSLLGRRGAAKEEEMGTRRNKEIILFLSFSFLLDSLSFLDSWCFRQIRSATDVQSSDVGIYSWAGSSRIKNNKVSRR